MARAEWETILWQDAAKTKPRTMLIRLGAPGDMRRSMDICLQENPATGEERYIIETEAFARFGISPRTARPGSLSWDEACREAEDWYRKSAELAIERIRNDAEMLPER